MVTTIQYVRVWLQTLLVKGNRGSLKNRLVRGAAGTFGVRIVSTGLGFLGSIILARLLGASGFGIYSYALTYTQLSILPATLGLDNLLVREVAIYKTQSAWGLMHGLLRWANQIVLLVSVGLTSIAIAIASHWWMGNDSQMQLAFCMAMTIVPIAALRNLRMAAMRGLNRIVMAQVPEMILAPLLSITFIGCAYLLLGKSLTVHWVLGMKVVAATIALAIGTLLLERALPDPVKKAIPEYRSRSWSRNAMPFMLLGMIFLIRTRADFLMLGAIKGAEVVGIYLAASRGAQPISFILMAVNTVLGPNIASLYSQGKVEQLQRVVTKSSRAILFISVPIIFAAIGFGYWYLLLFGAEFIQGQKALAILCVGQIVNAATGSVSLLLNMTGHESYTLIVGGICSGLNLILNLLFIPRWGIDGAAAATATTLVISSIANAIGAYKKLGIHCTAFGKII